MLKQWVGIIFVLLIGILVGCQTQDRAAEDVQSLQQQLAEIESRVDQLAAGGELDAVRSQVTALEQKVAAVESVNTADLAARVGELELYLEELQAGAVGEGIQVAGEGEQVFQVTVATYLLDGAGFHDMDVSINQEETIQPGYPGAVGRIRRLLAVTAWPEALQPQVAALMDTLDAFAQALAEDDVEAAKPLATQAHERQHDLSHAVEEWLASQGAGTE